MPANPELRLKVIDAIARGLSPKETILETGISNGGYHKLKKNPDVMAAVARRKKEIAQEKAQKKAAAKSADRPAVSVAVEVVGGQSALGRPSLLSDSKRDEIVRIIRDEGVSLYAAAPRVGVAYATANEWMRRGESRDNAGRPRTDDYANFASAVREAEAIYESRLVRWLTYSAMQPHDKRTKESDTNVQWILQRRFAARWGPTQSVNVQFESKLAEAKTEFITSLYSAIATSSLIPDDLKPVIFEVIGTASGDEAGDLAEG